VQIIYNINNNNNKQFDYLLLYYINLILIKQTVINIEVYHFANHLQNLSNILLSRLIPYAKEVIGDHQCCLRRNRSTIDHIICIAKRLRKYGNKMKKFISSL